MADLEIRPYADVDEDAVLEVLHSALGKAVDQRYREFFRWKHHGSPFGRSFMWVGEIDGRLAGFRAFLRWRFVGPGGERIAAVRAVDTGTHAEFQGRGVFRSLTMHALDEMRAAGIDFVFNTPNDQSRPGYLKMGWSVDGRVPVRVRPRSLTALWQMARANTSADIWSVPVDVGQPVHELAASVVAAPASVAGRLVTDRSPEFLRWRYDGCPAIASRALRAGGGAVLLRFRRRGRALECTVGDVVGPATPKEAGAAVRSALSAAGADYAIAAASCGIAGMVPVRRLGPVQTRRAVSEHPTVLPLALSLGDVETF